MLTNHGLFPGHASINQSIFIFHNYLIQVSRTQDLEIVVHIPHSTGQTELTDLLVAIISLKQAKNSNRMVKAIGNNIILG